MNFDYLLASFQLPGCDNVALVGNGFCNHETDIAACNYDGGDCCGPDVSCKWPFFIELFEIKLISYYIFIMPIMPV